jgi:hypothetical protein
MGTWILMRQGWHWSVAMGGALLAAAFVALCVERLAYRRSQKSDPEVPLVSSLGHSTPQPSCEKSTMVNSTTDPSPRLAVALIRTGRRSRRCSGIAPASANILAGMSSILRFRANHPAQIHITGDDLAACLPVHPIWISLQRSSATGRITAQAILVPLLPAGWLT